MVEIMGQNLDNAFEQLDVNADRMVETEETKLQVWQMSELEFDRLAAIPDEDWHEDFGWWRNGRCIYEGRATTEYIVNGEKMLGYGSDMELFGNEFITYSQWFNEAMNLSTDTNLVIFAKSLASDNGMSLSEFISKYEK
ncbi:hypothetical protein CIL05_07420 [Virgibacillus profundi]|uniref:Uncharacterized protein n=1 Tax=Virgibacillus profundi TaxID=2024555 RepID=A0A2A2IGM3_9BACI|nr:hypothetical protein [Virgibacillus profundi]PAV30290.1 hypothetical protein CIL05_07420 [Virgibacillus profundi]PXY54462.1 hypothetical protein CIT14_07505 [Virgibacillus profundi]